MFSLVLAQNLQAREDKDGSVPEEIAEGASGTQSGEYPGTAQPSGDTTTPAIGPTCILGHSGEWQKNKNLKKGKGGKKECKDHVGYQYWYKNMHLLHQNG